MIYTVTFNPSLDYIVAVDNFEVGMTNRTSEEQLYAGGKGINVSIVLKNLEIDSTALGFVAGFTGEEIIRRVKNAGIKADFISIKNGISRINVKLKSIEGTEINGLGPVIDRESISKLEKKLDTLTKGDTLVLAGSIPASLPNDTYEVIASKMLEKKVTVVVDATNNLLVNVLKHKPFLVKPNNYELGEIFGVKLKEKEDVIPYAKKLRQMGAKNVLVSMAAKGAVLVDEYGEVFTANSPKGTLVNGVGAGDSMVAGFLAGYIKFKNYEDAFRMGIAAGSASAFSEKLATKEEVEPIYKKVEVLR